MTKFNKRFIIIYSNNSKLDFYLYKQVNNYQRSYQNIVSYYIKLLEDYNIVG